MKLAKGEGTAILLVEEEKKTRSFPDDAGRCITDGVLRLTRQYLAALNAIVPNTVR